MENLIALIVKKEFQYIKEFIDYHLNIGFTKIIIADNNEENGENYNDLLKEYIDNGNVIIEDYRGKESPQMEFYNTIQNKYKYDWCAFIDCDEYITLNGYSDINEFLSNVPNTYDGIKISWEVYGANGQIYKENGTLIERFKVPMKIDFCYNYNFPENCHTKSIIRGNVEYNFNGNPHTVNKIKYCYPSEKNVFLDTNNSPFNYIIDYRGCCLRHYFTKSLEEWINTKMKRGRADVKDIYDSYSFNNFFKYNEEMKNNVDALNFIIKNVK